MMDPTQEDPQAPLGASQAPPDASQSAAGGGGLLDALQQQLQGSSVMFNKLGDGKKLLARARESMDELTALGDNVSPDDVVDMGGALVGAGLSPSAVAGLLAQMPPEGGQALAGWVTQQEQSLQQREAQMEQAHSAMQHHLGVNAMRMLMGHQGSAAAQPPANPGAAPLGLGGPANAG